MSVLEVMPGVYQIEFRIEFGYANVILVVEKNLTLIDAGFYGSSGAVLDSINRLGRSVDEIGLIIITHNHWDHVGGLPELRELTRAKVAAHRADFNLERLPYPKIVPKLAQAPILSHYRKFVYAESDEVDILLEGGEVFDVLGGLEVIHTPGHTPGSISLFSRPKRLLMVADTLAKHQQRIDPPTKWVCNDFPLAMQSVNRLAQLDFDTICFGHGRPLSGDVKDRVRALVKSYEP